MVFLLVLPDASSGVQHDRNVRAAGGGPVNRTVPQQSVWKNMIQKSGKGSQGSSFTAFVVSFSGTFGRNGYNSS